MTKTGRRSDYRKLDELAAWDIDKGSRAYIDTSTPARRRLRDRLRRQERKRINKMMWKVGIGGEGREAQLDREKREQKLRESEDSEWKN